jgi:putative flippase GtrA
MVRKMRFTDGSALRYALVGGLNTLLGLIMIYTAMWVFGFSDLIANLAGYSFALLISYALNKRWTFRHKGAHFPALLRFASVMAVAYLGNLTALLALVSVGLNSYLAQAAAVVPYAVIGYFGSRFIAFDSTNARVKVDCVTNHSKYLR